MKLRLGGGVSGDVGAALGATGIAYQRQSL